MLTSTTFVVNMINKLKAALCTFRELPKPVALKERIKIFFIPFVKIVAVYPFKLICYSGQINVLISNLALAIGLKMFAVPFTFIFAVVYIIAFQQKFSAMIVLFKERAVGYLTSAKEKILLKIRSFKGPKPKK
jgi:hypothetical protein